MESISRSKVNEGCMHIVIEQVVVTINKNHERLGELSNFPESPTCMVVLQAF